MSDERVTRVSVRVLDREYQVACPADERSDLLDSAEFLDAKMREVRESGKVAGLDRIAVISALNLANELIKLRRHGSSLDGGVGARVQRLPSGPASRVQWLGVRALSSSGHLASGGCHRRSFPDAFPSLRTSPHSPM